MNPYDYETRSGVLPVSWELFHSLCKGLALAAAEIQPEIILPVLRGGIFPGTLIAFLLQTDIHPLRLSRRVNDQPRYEKPRWILEPPALVHSRRVLIVDEIASTGETLRIARDKVVSLGAAQARTAVLYAHSRAVTVPDLIGLVSDELILHPWDREVCRGRNFLPHPEYLDAFSLQQTAPGSRTPEALLAGPPVVNPARSSTQ